MKSPKLVSGNHSSELITRTYPASGALHDLEDELVTPHARATEHLKELEDSIDTMKKRYGFSPLESAGVKLPTRGKADSILTKEEFEKIEKIWAEAEAKPSPPHKSTIMGMDFDDFIILRELLENYKKRKGAGRRSRAEERCDVLQIDLSNINIVLAEQKKEIDELRKENEDLKVQVAHLSWKVGEELSKMETKFTTSTKITKIAKEGAPHE